MDECIATSNFDSSKYKDRCSLKMTEMLAEHMIIVVDVLDCRSAKIKLTLHIIV
jgi:hypothetical protein